MQRKRILVLAALVTALLVEAGVVLAGAGPTRLSHAVPVQRTSPAPAKGSRKVIIGHAVSHFRTGPLRSLRPVPLHFHPEHEASPNPLPASRARHARDTVVQDRLARAHKAAANPELVGHAVPGGECTAPPP